MASVWVRGASRVVCKVPSSDTPLSLAPEDWERLGRYFGGELAADEAVAVERWLAADPRHRVFADTLRSLAAGPSAAGAPAAAVDRFRARLKQVTPQAVRPSAHVLRPNPWPRGVGGSGYRWVVLRTVAIAAALAPVATGFFVTWRLDHGTPAQQFREFASTVGSRATVTLRDGTRFVLAPATRLRVPANFGHADRTVELDGEALLVVVHDATHPFAVRTPRALVRDIGTTFVVRAYHGDASDLVVVQEGHVSLSGCDGPWRTDRRTDGAPSCPPARLGAGDVAVISNGRISITHRADVSAYAAWAQGRLVFEDTPLGDALRDVGRAFGLEITLADSTLATKPVTGAFGDAGSADAVLDAVTRVVGAGYERSGRRVVIRRRGSGVRGSGTDARAPLTTAQAAGTHE